MYGVDLGDLGRSGLDRSWRWLRCRIVGLLSVDARLSAALRPPTNFDAGATAPGSPASATATYDDPGG